MKISTKIELGNAINKCIMERSHLNALYDNAKKDVKYYKYAKKSFPGETLFLERLKNDLKECSKEYKEYRNKYENYQASNLLDADNFFYWISQLWKTLVLSRTKVGYTFLSSGNIAFGIETGKL